VGEGYGGWTPAVHCVLVHPDGISPSWSVVMLLTTTVAALGSAPPTRLALPQGSAAGRGGMRVSVSRFARQPTERHAL
jgi:hypothetical protein